jgi:hypothetical protein
MHGGDPRYGRLGQHGVALFLRSAERAPAGSVQRAIADQIRIDCRELDDIRVDGDCTCAPDAACVCTVPIRRLRAMRTDADSVVGLDLRRAARWLGADRCRELNPPGLPGHLRARAERRLVEATIAAADPTRADWATAVSLDELHAAFEALPDPDPQEEKTDMTTRSTVSPVVLAKAKRVIRSAYRFRSDADAPTRDELESLRELIALSKAEGIGLKELLDALQELKDISTGPAAKADASDGATGSRLVTLPGGGLRREGSRPPGGEAA